ncbi:MAG: Ornithine carbamoyltransferase [Candidatus Bathyarchaeota archaeon BA1]|nr:MAG: Ornithine carbamoyltransferase [Candidatus Bathyarchaeota archaeon BA1]
MAQDSLYGKDLITTQEWAIEEIEAILDLARGFKGKYARGEAPELLRRKTFFMLFYAPSTRTRAAFEAAMTILGGHAQFIDVSTTRLEVGEAIKDVAKMYERYGHGLGVRILDQAIDFVYGKGNWVVRECARHAEIPVINMACCSFHPTQGLADLMTAQEKLGNIQAKKYVIMWGYSRKFRGRCSIQEEMLIMTRFGMDVVLAYPPGFELDQKLVDAARENAANSGGHLEVTHDYKSALHGAHVVFPRNWASAALLKVGASQFGKENESRLHEKHRDWMLTQELVDLMDKRGIITHVLPVLRGEEAEDKVMDSSRSVIYDQAENGLYTKMAVLALTMGENK